MQKRTKKKLPLPLPTHLEGDNVAAVEWEKVVNRLNELSLLEESDSVLLELYVTTRILWLQADKACRELGETCEYPNGTVGPAQHYTQRNKHQDQLVKLSSMLGLSPADRKKMKVEKKQKSQNNWEGIL